MEFLKNIEEGTNEEILEHWEKVGFLIGIKDEDVKLKTALIMENMAKILMKENTFKNIDTIAFPVGFRVIRKLYDRKFKSDEQKEKLVNSLTSEFILTELDRLLTISTELYDEIYHGYDKDVDIEAETIAFISDRIEHLHYLQNYKK